MICCLVAVQLKQLILLAILSCLLRYIGIMSLSWVVKWTEETDSADKQSLKKEQRQKKVTRVEINIFSKH